MFVIFRKYISKASYSINNTLELGIFYIERNNWKWIREKFINNVN